MVSDTLSALRCLCLTRVSLFLQSALFNFEAFLIVMVLFICTCSYVRSWSPTTINTEYTHGFKGTVKNAAIIGDRLSPLVSAACVVFAVTNIFLRE